MQAPDHILDAMAWLGDQAEQRGVLEGAQVCAFIGDDLLVDSAVGSDGQRQPLTPETLGQLRCAVAKPLIGLTIASLIAEGRFDWSTSLGDLLDRPMHPDVAAATIDDVLCHRAGLHVLSGIALNIRGPEQRLDMALQAAPPEDWKRGRDSAYCESSGALILGHLIEEVTGSPYREVVEERVLGPSGIPPEHLRFRLTDGEFREYFDRIGTCSASIAGMHVPFLVEITQSIATEWNPSWSGYSTARGQALLHRHVMRLADGRDSNPYLPQSIMEDVLWARPNEADGTHQSDDLKLGRGFIFDMRIIQVPKRYSAGTFGHFGNAIAVGFADRELDLTVGLRFTNQNDNELQLMRIDRVVNSIYLAATGSDLLL